MKPSGTSAKKLPAALREELLQVLKARFERHMNRHAGLEWPAVQAKLEANPDKLGALHEMEATGVSRMWWGSMQRRVNVSSSIARQRRRKAV